MALTTIGIVDVLGPTASYAYYRCIWRDSERKRHATSAGRDLDGAKRKAEAINEQFSTPPAPSGTASITIGEAAEKYVASPIGRNHKTQGNWSTNQLAQVRRGMARMTREVADRPVSDLNRALADQMRAECGTPTMAAANTSILRGFIRWCAIMRYIPVESADNILPVRCIPVAPAWHRTPAPARARGTQLVGSSDEYVSDEDAPSAEQMIAAGEGLNEHFDWGRLAVEFAAECGPRWGEQMQLTAHDFDMEEQSFLIAWQINPLATKSNGLPRRIPPKHGKSRRPCWNAITITGYALHEALQARREQALQEQRDGTNPEALMFPGEDGDFLCSSTFGEVFRSVAEAAGWPLQRWTQTATRPDKTGTMVTRTTDRTQFDMTWHSLRHRYARTKIDIDGLSAGELMVDGGWKNRATVDNRYYRSGEEHRKSARKKIVGSVRTSTESAKQ